MNGKLKKQCLEVYLLLTMILKLLFRLSPRAISDLASARQRSKSTVDNRVPILESAAALDWSKLVNVASKAIDG